MVFIFWSCIKQLRYGIIFEAEAAELAAAAAEAEEEEVEAADPVKEKVSF